MLKDGCNMDIRINKNGESFKFRVGGIIKKDDKYLVVKINKNNFYCLIGGHVELNEDTESAVVREIKEELCVDVKVKALSCIFENFFISKSGRKFHELCFAYDVEIIDDVEIKDFTRQENDNGEMVKLEFKWLTIDEMKKEFKPEALIDVIESGKFKHIVIKQI